MSTIGNPALSGLDTAIANLSTEVDSAVEAITSLEAKAKQAGINVASEIATLTTFHDKLLTAINTVVANPTGGPVTGTPPGSSLPGTPVTGGGTPPTATTGSGSANPTGTA